MMTKTAILGVKDWLFSSIMQWLHWSADWVLQTVGWPGIIAGVASLLFLLSASVRAVRFLHSPKGLAASGAATLACLACTWWFMPEPLAPADTGPLVREETKAQAGSPAVPVLAAKLADADPAPPILASRVKSSPSMSGQPFMPILAIVDAGSPGPMPLLPLIPVPHIPPVIKKLPAHTPPAHVKPPTPAIQKPSHSSVAVTSPGNQRRSPGFNGGGSGFANGYGFGHAGFNHRPNIHQVNAAMAHGFDPFGFTMGGGYGHPMHAGGVGQMGGMHPGMVHGGHLGHH